MLDSYETLSDNGVGSTENDCVVKFRNYIQTLGEFGRLAESFALHFSGSAAARLDEPPLAKSIFLYFCLRCVSSTCNLKSMIKSSKFKFTS